MTKKLLHRFVCCVLILSLVSCGWKVTPPPFEQASSSKRKLIADSAVLSANDGGVIWGGGKLGEIVRQTLIDRGAFNEIYYPIEPRNPPDYRLVITAEGSVDEEIGLGVVKSIIIGVLFFIPAGIIRFNKDFVLDADVSVLMQDQELSHFKIHTATEVSHTMFSHANQYEPDARQKAFKDLALRIISKLESL